MQQNKVQDQVAESVVPNQHQGKGANPYLNVVNQSSSATGPIAYKQSLEFPSKQEQNGEENSMKKKQFILAIMLCGIIILVILLIAVIAGSQF